MYNTARELLEQAVVKKLFPGAAFCVGHGERLLDSYCTGRLSYDSTAPAVDSNTLYDIASMTKILCTTTLCLRAMETGRFYLQDTLGLFYEHLPEDKASITVQQLLTHSSGIIWHFFLSQQAASPEEAIDAVLEYPLAYSPGSRTEYSCMGFMLLRGILERLYGGGLEEIFHREVAQPLGLAHTGFCPDPARAIAPTVQQPDGSFLRGVVHDENAQFLRGVSANAGLFSTLEDVARYVRMLACSGRLDGQRYLSSATLRAAIRNYTPGCAHNRGLGFKLYGGTENFMGDLMSPASFGHTGFTGTSFAVEEPGGLWLVLLTNHVHPHRGNAEALRFRRLFYNAVTAEFHRG